MPVSCQTKGYNSSHTDAIPGAKWGIKTWLLAFLVPEAQASLAREDFFSSFIVCLLQKNDCILNAQDHFETHQ